MGNIPKPRCQRKAKFDALPADLLRYCEKVKAECRSYREIYFPVKEKVRENLSGGKE
jgi:hypothetical protein